MDTSVLIDYFRKKDKQKSYFFKLASEDNPGFAISVITEFEILFGSTDDQINFWEEVFSHLTILDLDSPYIHQAVEIQKELKRKRKMIDIPDFLIAATAVHHNFKIANQNTGHFSRIEKLQIVGES